MTKSGIQVQKRTYQLDMLRRQGKPRPFRFVEDGPVYDSDNSLALPSEAMRVRNATVSEGVKSPEGGDQQQREKKRSSSAGEEGEKKKEQEEEEKTSSSASSSPAEERKEEVTASTPPPAVLPVTPPAVVALEASTDSTHEKSLGSKKSEFHGMDPKEVAEELTMIDNQLFRKIERKELLKKNFMKPDEALAFNRMVVRFNLVSKRLNCL